MVSVPPTDFVQCPASSRLLCQQPGQKAALLWRSRKAPMGGVQETYPNTVFSIAPGWNAVNGRGWTHSLANHPKQHTGPQECLGGEQDVVKHPETESGDRKFVSCWRYSPNREQPAQKDDTSALRSCVWWTKPCISTAFLTSTACTDISGETKHSVWHSSSESCAFVLARKKT